MIPIASKEMISTNYVSRRIDAKLDRDTAILFKRLRLGLEMIGAFDNAGAEPTVAMALREIIKRVAQEAVEVGNNGVPVKQDKPQTKQEKPVPFTNDVPKARLPRGNK